MKKILSFLFLLLCVTPACAQQFKRIYLFSDFLQAKIIFRNHTTTSVLLNYDASNKVMLYRQGENLMELTSAAVIDTIVVDGHRFIPAEKCFYEVVMSKNGEIYIDWLLKDVNVGSKGALGAVTQGSVYNLQMSDFGNNDAMYYTPYGQQELGSTDIYLRKNDNTYYIKRDGKYTKAKTEKQLYKIFPTHKDEIAAFANENKIDMKDTGKALTLIDYCLSLDGK